MRGSASRCARACAGIVLACALAAITRAADQLPGAEIFSRKWISHDPRSGEGDGLGPLHNASSCVACHNQGGVGGGGDNEHNVDLLSVVSMKVRADDASRNLLSRRLIDLHPGFDAGNCRALPNLVLHRFGPESDYYELRAKLVERATTTARQRSAEAKPRAMQVSRRAARAQQQQSEDGLAFRITQRSAPALWGSGPDRLCSCHCPRTGGR